MPRTPRLALKAPVMQARRPLAARGYVSLRARRANEFAGYRFSACTRRLVSSVGRAPEREVTGSNPGQTNTQGL